MRLGAAAIALGAVLSSGCTSHPAAPSQAATPAPLATVRDWGIQLQGLDRDGAIDAVVQAPLDMVVLEPTRSVRGMEQFATKEMVARVRASAGSSRPHKLCLAYVNVGQAEDYRTYWQADWRAPTQSASGQPDFMLSLDPDGWPGNYPVAYWRPAWRELALGLIDAAVSDGFDGAFLDWVLGYGEPAVVAAAQREGVDPTAAMVDLLAALRARARQRNPAFVLIAQNAGELVEKLPAVRDAIDAVSQEDLLFRGQAGAPWGDPRGGDVAIDAGWAAVLEKRVRACRALGVAVFSLDYALRPDNAARAIAHARTLGAVPAVSQVSLERLPELPAQPAR